MEEDIDNSMSFSKMAITVVIAVIVIVTVAIPVIHDTSPDHPEEYENVSNFLYPDQPTSTSISFDTDLDKVSGNFTVSGVGPNLTATYNGQEHTVVLAKDGKHTESPLVFSNGLMVYYANVYSGEKFTVLIGDQSFGLCPNFSMERTNGKIAISLTDKDEASHQFTIDNKEDVFIAAEDGEYAVGKTMANVSGNANYVLYYNIAYANLPKFAGIYHDGVMSVGNPQEIVFTENVTDIEGYSIIKEYSYTGKYTHEGSNPVSLYMWNVAEKNIHSPTTTVSTILNIIPIFLVLGVLGLIVGFIRTGKDEEEAVTYDYER